MSIRSAYVHVPFCRHRCGYCNFTVIAKRDDLIEDYLRAMEIELGWLKEPQPVETLFYGGGTPTHLPAEELARFFAIVQRWFPVLEGAEVSVEANPEDIDEAKVDVLHRAGVNRVSLGVQSFRDAKLQTLERSHHGEDIERCLELLRPAIASVSLDLIFGSPDETLEQWQADLERAIALSPNHMSTYGLTYEPGTQFFVRRQKDELKQLPEETEGTMYEVAIDTLQKHDFEHYEVSNFARPGQRCRHNENYWECGEFFGVGPGASSYVDGARRSNHRSTTTYLKKVLNNESPLAESETLDDKAKAHERLVFGLRRLAGVNRSDFIATTGTDVTELVGESMQWLLDEGLLLMDDESVRLSRKGLLVSDSIWPYLL